jgi:hypothetical protein
MTALLVERMGAPADGETMGEVMFRGNIDKAASDEAFEGDWFHTATRGCSSRPSRQRFRSPAHLRSKTRPLKKAVAELASRVGLYSETPHA